MKGKGIWQLAVIFSMILVLAVSALACAAPTPTATPAPTPTPLPVATTPSPLLKAKQEAEAKGYIFETSHDEIVAKAKKEGKLKALSGLEPETWRNMRESFMKVYPFIDTYVEEITGTEAAQRFVLELQAGVAGGWDTTHCTSDLYNDYTPYMKKFDILGMTEQGVLSIPTGMVDPYIRNVVSMTSSVSIVAYNKSLISPDKVPSTWEDFLKPEFKGKKFVVDIRPHPYTAMVPQMGLDWVLDYARKLATQQPVWARGQTRILTSMTAGEYALHAAINYHSTVRAMGSDPTGNLQIKIIEPVPVRVSEPDAILDTAPHPYAGLLWLEFEAGPTGQAIIDKYDPLKSSIWAPGSSVEKLIRGRKLSVLGWDAFHNKQDWTGVVVEAFGFPKAEISG